MDFSSDIHIYAWGWEENLLSAFSHKSEKPMTTQNHFKEIQEEYTQKGVGDFRNTYDGLVEEVTPVGEL